MTEEEMADKILSIVSGQNTTEILAALTMATAVIVKSCVKKDQVEGLAEEFKKGLIAMVRRANVTIAIVKMRDNG